MKAGLDPQGKATTLSSMFEAVGAFKSGLMTEEEFLEMEQNACLLVDLVLVCSQLTP